MNRVVRYITCLTFAVNIFTDVSGEAHAQDMCNLGERFVEILSTVDACAATSEQLAELEGMRQEILTAYDDTDCGELEERLLQLVLTLPRRPGRWPATLEQPVPICELTLNVPLSYMTVIEGEKSRVASKWRLMRDLICGDAPTMTSTFLH